jgi:hypothetical protein
MSGMMHIADSSIAERPPWYEAELYDARSLVGHVNAFI